MSEKTRYSHDGAYKLLFSHPEMVEGLLKGFVSEELIGNFDFDTLEHCSGSYVTDDLRERHDDIVWRLRWQGTWCYVYILLEFQSTVDPWMAIRIANYTTLLYQDIVKNNGMIGGQLPPVFPLVLYNGLQEWDAPCDVGECIVSLSPVLDKYQLRQKYFIVDMGRIPAKVLGNIHNAAISLVRIERGKTPEAIRIAIAELEKVLRSPEYTSLRRAFTVWLNRIVLRKLQVKEPIPEFNDLQEIDAMLAETVTQWTQQWKMEGLQEGIQKGIQEGIRLGEAKGEARGEARGKTIGEAMGKTIGEIMGLRVAVFELLSEQFTAVPVHLAEKLYNIQAPDVLRGLIPLTLKSNSLETFEAFVDKAIGR